MALVPACQASRGEARRPADFGNPANRKPLSRLSILVAGRHVNTSNISSAHSCPCPAIEMEVRCAVSNLISRFKLAYSLPHFHASNYFLDGCLMLGFAPGKQFNLVLIITLHRERQGALGRRPGTDWRTLGFSESPCANLSGCQEEVPRGHCIFPWVDVFRRHSLIAASSRFAGSSIFRVFVWLSISPSSRKGA